MFDLPKDKILDAMYKVSFNYKIAEYYQTMFMMTDEDKYARKCVRISNCYKYFNIDVYNKQQITDIKQISLCNDKFCKNCQNILSKQRYIRFKPFLENLSDMYDLYHVTLTVPNVSGLFLNDTLDKMYDAFGRFIKVFRRKNCKHQYLNLDSLGYQGAVRSLEITLEQGRKYYFHPHFHCIFAIKKDLDLERCIVNKFSYNNGVFERAFTSFEQTIQKLWYLVYNNIRITEDNFMEAEGYSCTAELTNYDYKEVFKYTLKETFDDLVNDEVIFLTLERALRNRRIIQGYGALFGISDLLDEEILQDAESSYLQYVNSLAAQEKPLPLTIEYYMLRNEIDINPDMQFISRNSIKGVITYEEE